MKFRAWIRAIQSPEPKAGEEAMVKIVLETYRQNVDVNELLDLRDNGSVVLELLPVTAQQKMALAAEKKGA